MRRRDKTGGKEEKTQRRKTLKRRNAPTVRLRSSAATAKKTNVARLARERDEALEQLAATSEVLQVISASPGELQPVFEAMLANAVRLCEASYGAMWLREGGGLRNAAFHGALPEAYTGQWRKGMVTQAGVDAPLNRVAQSRKPVHIADVRTDRSYLDGHPLVVAAVDVAGVRTYLGVPMLKAGEVVGCISIYRQEVRPFTNKQIELLTNFAAQAVIAIENARLLNELRESLQQQTATADVLKVISSSPGELGPVFQAILENATRICEAEFGQIFQFDGESFERTADVGTPPVFTEFLKRQGRFKPLQGSHLDRVMRTKQVSHTGDYAAEGIPSPPVKLGGARSTVDVPMLKDDELIGALSIYRQEVRPFTDKQITLLTNFAAQAVIAIENARLLNELRQSLEQQTATADVLKVISSSPGDLEPVFQSMLVKAVQICEAKFGVLFRCYHDSEFHAVAWVGVTPEYEESLRKRQSFRPDADAPLGRLLLTKEFVHTADELAEKAAVLLPSTVAHVP